MIQISEKRIFTTTTTTTKKKTQNHRLPSILYKISYLIELKMDKYIFHNILKKQTLKINTISLVLYEIFLPTLLKR